MAMRRREPPVPLTIQGLDEKLDQLMAGQASYGDLLRRLADGQERHAEVLDLHTTKLNELVSGQNAHTELLSAHTELLSAHSELLRGHTELLSGHTELLSGHTELLRELVRGQKEQTGLLQQLLRNRGEDPAI
jgi:hypothetical protein